MSACDSPQNSAQTAGDHVRLAGQARHPEVVDDIHRLQRDAHRAAHRDVHVAGGDDGILGLADARVLELEPPLVAHGRDFNRVLRVAGQLGRLGLRAEGEDCDHQHNQRRRDRPEDLDLGVAVDLGWDSV
jgi:hypothetical protein